MIRQAVTVVLWAALIIGSVPASLAATSGTGANADERARFSEAMKRLKRGDRQTFRRLKAGLKDYILYPYLEYAELNRYRSHASAAQIEQFLTRYADTPLAPRLRSQWLKDLAKRKQWNQYLRFWNGKGGTSAQCRFRLAQVKTGNIKDSAEAIEKLWLHGRSRPKACDPLFKAWIDARMIDDALVWQRINLALNRGQVSLARYLRRFLPASEHRWVDLWLKVHAKPNRVLQKALFKRSHPMRETILLHGVKRQARKDAPKSLKTWETVRTRYEFTQAQQQEASRWIGLRMAFQGESDAIELFDDLPNDALDKKAREWRIRAAMRFGNWKKVRQWVEALPKEEAAENNWRYWHARSLEQLGLNNEARKIYAGLSLERDYFGFLAADRLGLDYSLGHSPIQASASELKALRQIGSVARADELRQIGRLIDARREWRHALKGMSRAQLIRSAKLARQWGWHHRSILTAAKARHWDDLETRFPVLHRTPVEKHARKRKIDQSWVYAVVRQESAFAIDARSPAGAMGLMQLMPATARQVAKATRTNLKSQRDLYKAEVNIKLGTAYLRQVLNQLGNNTVLATAAYNAGPHRVRRWLPEDASLPADVWIENIPFNETRHYLQRVMAYTVIYENRLGLPTSRLSDRMYDVTNLETLKKKPQRRASVS